MTATWKCELCRASGVVAEGRDATLELLAHNRRRHPDPIRQWNQDIKNGASP